MLTLQHFIKGYGIYINFDNFTSKVVGCIGTAKRNSWHSRNSVTNYLIFSTTYFSFDEVSLKREVKLAVIIFYFYLFKFYDIHIFDDNRYT